MATANVGRDMKSWTMPAWLVPLTTHISGQFARYLMVGAVNTLFGYSSFAILTALLTPFIPYSYVVASVISNLINITFSYLNYKSFVFKTRGNYAREWFRCVAVYSGGIAIGALLLPVIVFLLRRIFHAGSAAPYLAGGILTCMTAVYSFLSHRTFSFHAASKTTQNRAGAV